VQARPRSEPVRQWQERSYWRSEQAAPGLPTGRSCAATERRARGDAPDCQARRAARPSGTRTVQPRASAQKKRAAAPVPTAARPRAEATSAGGCSSAGRDLRPGAVADRCGAASAAAGRGPGSPAGSGDRAAGASDTAAGAGSTGAARTRGAQLPQPSPPSRSTTTESARPLLPQESRRARILSRHKERVARRPPFQSPAAGSEEVDEKDDQQDDEDGSDSDVHAASSSALPCGTGSDPVKPRWLVDLPGDGAVPARSRAKPRPRFVLVEGWEGGGSRPPPSQPCLVEYSTPVNCSRTSLAHGVSIRYVLSVARHIASPVTVTETIRFDSTPPRK
jgi:hypothetical protein